MTAKAKMATPIKYAKSEGIAFFPDNGANRTGLVFLNGRKVGRIEKVEGGYRFRTKGPRPLFGEIMADTRAVLASL